MISLVNFINESQELNESLKSSILIKVADLIKKKSGGNKSLKSLERFDWDKVTDDMFEKYVGIDAKKAVDRLTSFRKNSFSGIAIICMDDENEPTEVLNQNKLLVDFKTGIWAVEDRRSDFLYDAENAKAVYILKSEGHETYNMIMRRQSSQQGVVDAHDPEAMRKLARANMERYAKIIAQNKALKGDDMAAQVQQVMNEVLGYINKLSADIVSYNEKYYEVQKVMELTYGKNMMDYNMKRSYHAEGLLQMLTRYMESRSRNAAGKGYAFDASDVEQLRPRMIALIKTIKEKLSKLV